MDKFDVLWGTSDSPYHHKTEIAARIGAVVAALEITKDLAYSRVISQQIRHDTNGVGAGTLRR